MLNVRMNNSKITVYVVSCWIFAAFGGLMFGYDIAATKLGRKITILTASIFFIVGAVLSAVAENKLMLIFGRILFGIGVGFGNETVPLFLTEVAPIQHRGAVNIMFQLFVTIGIFIANLVNYGTSMIHPNGWRMSLGFAAIPAGKSTLVKIRGVSDVEAEYREIVAACEQAKQVKQHSLKNLLKPASIPPLVIDMGFKANASLLSSVITGIVNVGSTFVSIYLVDKVGRRKLLLQACCQMLISQLAIRTILVTSLSETGTLNRTLAAIVVLLVCTYVMSFAWSWGPLGWLIPSESFPLETRTTGFAFAVSTNMLFTSIIAQLFLTMLCTMKAYIFFFFFGWIVVMGLFVFFFLPETKGVPIDSMVERVWMQHPIWRRLF
ncbi:hypothetical protein KY285_000225 [Solanum tuberosum]|nr:hypothetical protein KY284_000250 [Solanum tuberosum]KAH0764354.1 hypothetical protein KY285_000225 [Solanum tuberosum]